MKTYTCTAAVNFHIGTVLGLTKDQVASRAHNLEPAGKGLWRVVNAVQFKAGERIGLDGEPPKALALIDDGKSGKAAAEAEAKVKAEAEAKAKAEAEAKAKAEGQPNA